MNSNNDYYRGFTNLKWIRQTIKLNSRNFTLVRKNVFGEYLRQKPNVGKI